MALDTKFFADEMGLTGDLKLGGPYILKVDGKEIQVVYIGPEFGGSDQTPKVFEEFGRMNGDDAEIYSIPREIFKREGEKIILENRKYFRKTLNVENKDPLNKIMLRGVNYLIQKKFGNSRKV